MDPVKVTVVIPVYNSESYIERCVRSLMEQSFEEGIEFLFIDDASSDNSMLLLNQVISEYPSRSHQIRVIRHDINQGIAFTRGEGIREAKGVYLGWCDSDDWCESSMFLSLYQCARNLDADIVACGIQLDYANASILEEKNYPEIGVDYLQGLYKRSSAFTSLCDKIIRRSIFLDNDIFPYEGINISEDMNLTLRAFYYARRVSNIPEHYYHYDCTEHESLTHRPNDRERRQQNYRNDELISQFLTSKDPKRFRYTCNLIKFMSKVPVYDTFDDKRLYYETFRECHCDIFRFSAYSWFDRVKWMLMFSSYPSLRLAHWFKNLLAH